MRLLADLILILHAAFIAFVILGLVLIWAGYFLNWRWTRTWSFRLAHLAAIALVVVQAFLGIACPLTIWESKLRIRAGQDQYGEGGFIEHWLHQLIFFEAPTWVFTLVYTLFGVIVIATMILIPPRRKRATDHVEGAGVASPAAASPADTGAPHSGQTAERSMSSE